MSYPSFLTDDIEKMARDYRETRRIKMRDLVNERSGFKKTDEDDDLLPNDERLYPDEG